MWQSKQFAHAATVTDTGFNTVLKNALNAAVMPANKATAHAKQASANTDAERRTGIDAYGLALDHLVIDPWTHGRSAESKQTPAFWLSPPEAMALLQKNLEKVDWQECLVMMVTGINEAQLAEALEGLLAAFPNQALEKSKRHAEALASHQRDKLFVAIGNDHTERSSSLDRLQAFAGLTDAKENLAIAEACASDENPASMLADFKAKRAARLDQVKTQLTTMATHTGEIRLTLHLQGEYLGDQLAAVPVPEPNAPLCCLYCVGGSATAMRQLTELLT